MKLIIIGHDHICPSNGSVQIWRQVESFLMGHLWGKSSRVRFLIGSMNARTCPFLSGGLGVDIYAPFSCCFWAPIDLQQRLHDKSVPDFVHHADRVWHSPGLQVFQLELSHLGRGTWGGAEVIKDAAGWSLLHHLQSGFQMLLMGAPHHIGILQHWSRKALVAVCLDSSGWAFVQVLVCKGAHFAGFCSSWLDVFCSKVLCVGISLVGLVVEL